jgi:methionyl-tRNA synthetase
MKRVDTIMHLSLQIAANLAIAFEPFLPFTSVKLRTMLGMTTFSWMDLGKIDLLKAGSQLEAPELLFEKIEDDAVEAQVQKLLDTKKANETANYKAAPVKENVAFEDFMKMDIRVGTVLECKRVPKADKLLQFRIADGLEERTILSGIAQHYPNPDELTGTQVCFIANFEPRKLRGIMSEGMILSAEDADGKLVLIQPKVPVTNGVEVK